MGDLTLIIQFLLNNTTLVGVISIFASFLGALTSFLQKTGFLEEFLKKKPQEEKATHMITIIVDGHEIAINRFTTEQDAKTALKLAQKFLEKKKTEEPSTLTSHADDVNVEDI